MEMEGGKVENGKSKVLLTLSRNTSSYLHFRYVGLWSISPIIEFIE